MLKTIVRRNREVTEAQLRTFDAKPVEERHRLLFEWYKRQVERDTTVLSGLPGYD